MMQKTGSFVVKDAAGREYVVHVLMNPADGWTELRSDDGNPVTRSEKGKYMMYWPIRVVTSDDPNAP